MADMWIQTLLAVFIAIPPTTAAIIGIILTIQNKNKINDIHIIINGRFDQFVETIKKVAFDEGVKFSENKNRNV